MKKSLPDPSILPEYDFRGGIRGKHAQAYRQGHTAEVRHADGTTTLEEGAVILEPDVREYFPDPAPVIQALRGLIELIPSKRRSRQRKA
jgi:hypothetical protein